MDRIRWKNVTAAAIAAATLLTVSACEWENDAPRAAVDETSPAVVIQMPDGFSNVATKCVGGLRYSTVYASGGAYGALSVVADPACPR